MNYEQARQFAAEAAKKGCVPGLEGMQRLMTELGDVQETLSIVHLAGTNGKGSVGAFLESIFRAYGWTVARYTSPAVFDPMEVWTLNGEPMTKEDYALVMTKIQEACERLAAKGFEKPTVFEIETAAAFVYFSEKKPDILLLETGMGGRLDATNIIRHPLACVLTSISMDHMQFLGDSLAKIAEEKAGIIKEGCPVFAAVQQEEVASVLQKQALAKNAPLFLCREEQINVVSHTVDKLSFSYKNFIFETGMSGIYQMYNAALAIELALFLGKKQQVSQLLEKTMEGIRVARWSGRFEKVSEHPLLIVDGAHNADAAKRLAETIENCFTNTPLTYIIGVLADKEYEKMLSILLPYATKVYTVTPEHVRALSAEQLAVAAQNWHTDVTCCESIEQAVWLAKEYGQPIVAFGSLSYLCQLKECIGSNGNIDWR